MKFIFFISMLVSQASFAQSLAYTDPAAAYNKLLLDNSEGSTYDIVGTYKVQGNPYLFGILNGKINCKDGSFSPSGSYRYNTYTQILEVFNDNSNKLFVSKNVSDIDSFSLKAKEEFLKNDLYFISSKMIDSSTNTFMQVLQTGNELILYKSYFSVLGIVGTNYVQSELRQYELQFNYYYSSKLFKGFKKIKLKKSWLNNEFSKYNTNNKLEDDFSVNSELFLKNLFFNINTN